MKVHIVSDNKLVQVNNENGMRKLKKNEELRERKVGGERLGGSWRKGGRKNEMEKQVTCVGCKKREKKNKNTKEIHLKLYFVK